MGEMTICILGVKALKTMGMIEWLMETEEVGIVTIQCMGVLATEVTSIEGAPRDLEEEAIIPMREPVSAPILKQEASTIILIIKFSGKNSLKIKRRKVG